MIKIEIIKLSNVVAKRLVEMKNKKVLISGRQPLSKLIGTTFYLGRVLKSEYFEVMSHVYAS